MIAAIPPTTGAVVVASPVLGTGLAAGLAGSGSASNTHSPANSPSFLSMVSSGGNSLNFQVPPSTLTSVLEGLLDLTLEPVT